MFKQSGKKLGVGKRMIRKGRWGATGQRGLRGLREWRGAGAARGEGWSRNTDRKTDRRMNKGGEGIQKGVGGGRARVMLRESEGKRQRKRERERERESEHLVSRRVQSRENRGNAWVRQQAVRQRVRRSERE